VITCRGRVAMISISGCTKSVGRYTPVLVLVLG